MIKAELFRFACQVPEATDTAFIRVNWPSSPAFFKIPDYILSLFE